MPQVCLLYNITKHNGYKGLHHGQLNRVFELAGMLCQPRLEPIVRKWKAAVPLPAPVPPPQKTVKNRARSSIRGA
jgi:hypothetical protein